MLVLGGWASSHEQGTPAPGNPGENPIVSHYWINFPGEQMDAVCMTHCVCGGGWGTEVVRVAP